MSNECQLRFKGVENFFRKVAFNLGNTASQTEVKIISCIPIDVTDLQQKILQLERQLESATRKETLPQKPTVRNETITPKLSAPKEGIFTCDAIDKHVNNVAISCNRLFPTEYESGEDTHKHNAQLINSMFCSSELCTKILPEPVPEPQDFANTDSELAEQVEQQPANIKAHKGFFRKKRKFPKKRIMNTQLVYYTQSQAKSPFDYYSPGDGTSKMRGKKDSTNVNKSHFNDVYRKLYKYKPAMLNENANESEFSTPICRDVLPTKKEAEILIPETDMCSCCHGPFQNVDDHVHRYNHFNLAAPSARRENRNAYYDSNLYDVVPVKENAPKVKHDVINRHETNDSINIACWPEKMRPKYKIPRVISTHHPQAPIRHQIKILRKAPAKPQYRKDAATNKVVRIKSTYNPSKTRSVEFSEIYAKRLMKTRRKIAKVAYKEATKRQDRACLTTTVITNTECQTASLSHVQPREQKREEDVKATTTTKHLGNETDVTLNQIKNILQTVLAEVKTNSKIINVPEHEKKDAIVQNGPSQSHIFGGSSFLHSFTYSPYNINSYGASCSRQIPTTCYPPNVPTSPIKCVQYPLFIQPGRPMCTNCYKTNPLSFNHPPNNPLDNPLNHPLNSPVNHPLNIGSNVKHATSAATNTEQSQSRSKETENLIKEIYKSMALNQDSSKDARISERSNVTDNLKMFESSTSEEREAKFIAKAISEIFKNTKPIETSETRSISTPDSKLTSAHQSSLKNHQVKEILSEYHSENEKSNSADSDETEQVRRGLRLSEYDDESNCTVVNEEESDSDVTETESRVLKTKPEANQKTSIFSKMLKIFKPKSRQRHFKTRVTKNITVVEEETSESSSASDLQTEYSHTAAYKPVHKTGRYKTRPKVFAAKQHRYEDAPQIKSITRRSPYMEQEYRRCFDEKLTFHDNGEARFLSTRHTPQKTPVYYQKIDARSVLTNAYPSHGYNYRANIPARDHSPPKVMHTRYSPGRAMRHDSGIIPPKDVPGNSTPRVMTQGSGNSPPRVMTQGPGNFPARTMRKYGNENFPDSANWYDRGNSPERVNWYDRGMSPNRGLWYDRGISPDRAMAGRYAPRMKVRHDNGNQTVFNAQSPAKLTKAPAKLSASPKAMAWLKKQKIGIRCGQQWKRLILEG